MTAAKASAEGHVDQWRNQLVNDEQAYDKANVVSYNYLYNQAPTIEKNDKANFKLFKDWWCTGDDGQKIKNCVVGVSKDKLFNPDTFMQWYRIHKGEVLYNQVVQVPNYGVEQSSGEITKDTVKTWISNGYNAWLLTGGKSVHVDCGGYCY
nr:hypothetical protein [uncultured Nitrososphaera sp.]